MPTDKHNLRIPEEIWGPAAIKAARLQALGYVIQEGHKPGLVDVTKVIRAELGTFAKETDAETITRLGLTKAA